MQTRAWAPAIVLGLIVAAGSAHASERVAVCARYGVQDGYSHGYTVDATLTNGRELDQATGTFNYDALATYVVIFWSQDEVSVIRMDWNTLSAIPLNGTDQRGRQWQISSMEPGSICY